MEWNYDGELALNGGYRMWLHNHTNGGFFWALYLRTSRRAICKMDWSLPMAEAMSNAEAFLRDVCPHLIPGQEPAVEPVPDPVAQVCGTCRFRCGWWCKRHAPSLEYCECGGNKYPLNTFPEVLESDWCGDWEAKKGGV